MKQRKDGRWLKVKTINGEKISFYSKAKTEKQAIKDIENQMLLYKEKLYNKNHNFKELADAMLKQKELTVGFKTLEGYELSLKHLHKLFDLDIEAIKPSNLQNILDDMGRKKYSQSAISKVKITFGLVLNYAIVDLDLPLNNFMRSIKLPRTVPKKKVKPPANDVIDIITTNANKAFFGMWAMTMLCTGLRPGEVNALQRKDVDFTENKIYVNNSVEFIGNTPRVKEMPKTEEGVRFTPILDVFRPFLEQLCINLKPEDFLFGGATPFSKTQLRKRWNKYRKEIGRTFTQYQLRHGYAALLYKSGVDPKTAQHLLGHADFTTTMNIYTAFENEVTEKKIKLINEYTSKTFKLVKD